MLQANHFADVGELVRFGDPRVVDQLVVVGGHEPLERMPDDQELRKAPRKLRHFSQVFCSEHAVGGVVKTGPVAELLMHVGSKQKLLREHCELLDTFFERI